MREYTEGGDELFRDEARAIEACKEGNHDLFVDGPAKNFWVIVPGAEEGTWLLKDIHDALMSHVTTDVDWRACV